MSIKGQESVEADPRKLRGGRGGGGGNPWSHTLVMKEPTPMLPGMMPYCPFCAEVAPLRVTHSCLSTFSPLRGSCHHTAALTQLPLT